MEELLRAVGLSKKFGALPALVQVDLTVGAGQVLGVAGESGSGKSVLLGILAGIHQPDSGELFFAGRRLRWPFHAPSLGIGLVPQKPVLVEHLDIVGNILLGRELGWRFTARWLDVLSRKRMEAEAQRVLDQLGIEVGSLRQKTADLSSEQRQMLSIARVVALGPRLVLADDPGPLLNYANQQRFLAQIQAWQQAGAGVVFASNNLDHLFAVTDRILVLRDGRKVADLPTERLTQEAVVSAMAGTTDQEYLTPVVWALKSYYRTRQQADQLQTDVVDLQRDLSDRDRLNRTLLEQLAEHVNALDLANQQLREAHRRLLTEREEERKRLARELHDGTIQDLLSLNYELEDLAAGDDLPAAVQEALLGIRTEIRTLIGDLRHICSDLRPPSIDSLGLGAALQSYCHEWGRRSGIPVELDLDPLLARLPEETELSIFRIVQEALNNVRLHSGASRAQVSLRHTSPRAVLITVADNGCGLPEGCCDLHALAERGHYGLLGISERVELAGGRLKLQNRAEGGLLLQAEIPHPRVQRRAVSSRAARPQAVA